MAERRRDVRAKHLSPAGLVHGLTGVLKEPLRATERAGNVEAVVEAPEILRGLERFFEGRLGEPERAVEALQLALVDVLACGYSR